MNLREAILPLRRRLARLRGRARRLLLLLGTARVVAALVVTLVLYFLADYFLRLPLGVRQTLALLLAAGLGTLFYRRVLRPLATSLDDQMLAARVEAAHPELQDRLCSSLSFATAAQDPENEDSPELMRAVVEETTLMAREIPFVQVARARTPVRWAAAAAILLMGMGIAATSRAELVSTFLQRSFLLRDVAWPRRTTLTVVDMRPGQPRRVTRGRETTIEIAVEGSIPDRVRFSYWEQGAKKRTRETMELTPRAEDRARFAITLPVYASYGFTVAGGDDDRRRVYSIEALTPPSILSIEMDCTYPVYLEREPETLAGGDQRVPEGTKVLLRIRSNLELVQAQVRFDQADPVDLQALAPDRFTARFEARKDLRYSVRLRGANGEQNDPAADTFILRVLKDQAPVVRVHTPSTRTERVAHGVVLLSFGARDDHAVRSARLLFKINDGKLRTLELGGGGGPAARLLESPRREPDYLPALAVLDLARVRKDDGKPVADGDTLTCMVEATDSAGQTQRARAQVRVAVLAEEEITHETQGSQNRLRESVERTDGHARTAVVDLEEMRIQRGRDADEFRRWSGRAQAAQARVISDLDALSRQVRGVLNLYVFNRLDSDTAVDEMLPYFERHLLEPSGRAGTPFRGSLYRELWTAQQQRAIRARGALVKLVEMADLSDRLAADHGPRAYAALGRLDSHLSSRETDQAIRQATYEQKIIRDGLARMARLVHEWQSYEGVVRFFQSLRDNEKRLIEQLEGIDASEKSGDD